MNSFCKKRIESFKYAFQGVAALFGGTPNAVVHLILAVAAIAMGLIFSISTAEWLAVTIVIGLVLALEAVNSSIEALANHVSKDRSDAIRRVKDLAAAAVLLAASAALAVGLLIFLPKIIELFQC
ncbi:MULTISPECIES: diacylglycerol kinase family protein [Petrimonas]|jgi:diacylglycerol kinase|uniref:Diacylglycerol kinase n=1 Tax=Petrimonas mucosa TaxID=1642646 RepID=A0A1G4G6N6_9BACT|nr:MULTISPECIES: diacylglycerol kinase family protein [Petrimonas]MDD3561689.1 diacylglycerol kinase family protein [Petrimonas mucosa]SCM57526.1 Diacylglycerol kinase {ECO:0000313/EMBL:KEJ83870,1} [Petrimonas mucosa]SFU70530.1 diacylglycerol kinase (ATP) [Porphyromonadaceae bacterium KHP3R9]HHT28723.1 diacylglycerol kinase family protein [Petrimonas mucosa]